MKNAYIRSISGEVLHCIATRRHPACSYGQQVWVTVDGNNAIMPVESRVDCPTYEVLETWDSDVIDDIRDYMSRNNITLQALSDNGNVPFGTVSTALSRKDGGNPYLRTLEGICDALGVYLTLHDSVAVLNAEELGIQKTLKAEMAVTGETSASIARKVNSYNTYISKVLREGSNPIISTIIMIAEALGTPLTIKEKGTI